MGEAILESQTGVYTSIRELDCNTIDVPECAINGGFCQGTDEIWVFLKAGREFLV
jgi:hypothetical protein